MNVLLALPGGRQGKMPVTALEAFDLEMNSWTRYPCIPSRRAFSCCATNERSLFSLGGLQQPGPHNFYSRPHFVSTMEEYDLDQGKWGPIYTVSGNIRTFKAGPPRVFMRWPLHNLVVYLPLSLLQPVTFSYLAAWIILSKLTQLVADYC